MFFPIFVIVTAILLLFSWGFLRRYFFPTILENIPGPPGHSWITGSQDVLFSRSTGWQFHRKIAETYGGVLRLKGLFGADNLYVFDSKALQHILVKDQHIYEETASFIEGNKMVFGDGIFTSIGESHRRQRRMLNSIFSTSHLREMTPVFYEVAHRLRGAFLTKVQKGPAEVDISSWTTRLALELIGQSGLGYSFDTLADGTEPHPYGLASKEFVPLTADSTAFSRNVLLPIVARIGTPRFRRFCVDVFPSKKLHRIRDIVDILHNTSIEIYESKKIALEEGDDAMNAQVGGGKDVFSLLMRANSKTSSVNKLSDAEVFGQISSLTFAGTDTASAALSRIIHLLAIHEDVQNLARQEIRSARSDNKGHDLSYDILVSLPYLDAIVKETLRLYPPVTTLMRTTRDDTVLPLGTPVTGLDGGTIHEIPVPKGTDVFISILAANRNPELWGPDSYEWKPERWRSPLPSALVEAQIPSVFSHLLTFIGGPRSCIGFKFSQLEIKVVLASLLDYIEFSLSDKEIVWQMTAITTPNVDSVAVVPALPMIISRVK